MPSPKVTLSIQRDCTGNDCGETATASGVLDPVQAGRPVDAAAPERHLVGDGRRCSPATTGADGKVADPVPARRGAPVDDPHLPPQSQRWTDPAVTSNQIQFMPGPTELGKNVLRVDVDKGIYPDDQGPGVRPAMATLSVGRRVDPRPRGAGEVRRPRQLHRQVHQEAVQAEVPGQARKATGVFGMPRGKSWTLLASFLDQSFVRDKVGLDLGPPHEGQHRAGRRTAATSRCSSTTSTAAPT